VEELIIYTVMILEKGNYIIYANAGKNVSKVCIEVVGQVLCKYVRDGI
jgi:hypothetical protein